MWTMPGERARVRGHRIVGPVRVPPDGRHYWIAGAIALISAGVSAYSASQQAAAQSQQARRQARMAEQQAEYARQAADLDARTKQRQYERTLGSMRARFGAAGVIPEEGTPLLVLMQSEEEAALDVARVRHGGAVAAHGFTLEAQEARLRGRQARRQGTFAMTAALLQGVSGAYRQYKVPTKTPSPTDYTTDYTTLNY